MIALNRRELLEGLGAIGCAGKPAALIAAASPSPDPRTRAVELGLLERTRIEGEAPRPLALHDRMAFYGVSGVQIAVIDDGRVSWNRAYGRVRAGGAALTENARFQAGSISKSLTAFAAMRLVEHERLLLDDDVNRQLRSWQIPESAFTSARPVTVRQLLSHTAGLSMPRFLGYEPGSPLPTTFQTLAGTGPANSGRLTVDAQPGTAWRYSGGGYVLMQQLLEDATGVPFRQLMQRAVLKPTGMRSSTFELLFPRRASQAAFGHLIDGTPLPEGWFMLPEAGAAGLWSTSRDLARFVLAIQTALRAEPKALLSQNLAAQMVVPGMNNWGLGLEMSGEGDALRFGHGGGTQGYRSQVLGFAHSGRGIAVLTNGEIGDQLIGEIVRAVAKVYDWPAYPQRVRAVAPHDPTTRQFAGQYRIEGDRGGIMTIALDGTGQLTANVPIWGGWANARAMYRSKGDSYFFREHSGELHFARRPDGSVSEVRLENFTVATRAVPINGA